MEFLFIKRIVDKNLFENNSKTVIYNDLFNYHSEKTELIKYSNNNTDNENNKEKDKDDYEFVSLTPLNEKEEEEMNNYMTQVKEEIVRIEKVIEYMIVNIPDIHKIKLLNYKTYDYDNTSKFIKSKVKAKANNHNFDILKFILKNKINKDEVLMKIKEMTVKDVGSSISENKLTVYYLIIKIIEFYNIYNKCLNYSLKLLEENPCLYRDKDECLSIIDKKFINLTNDELNFYHHDQIKNAYSASNKHGETIVLKRGADKNFEILFK